jgi:dihydrofolate reductase
MVFEAVLPVTNTIYYTQVHLNGEGDTFFPEINMNEWNIQKIRYVKHDENNDYDFDIFEYTRKTPLSQLSFSDIRS